MPRTNPVCYPTVFTDRFWDEMERWSTLGVGLVPGSMKPYFGDLPDPTPGHITGTPAQYAFGLDYNTYISGGYSDPCGCAPIGWRPKDKAGIKIGERESAGYAPPFDRGGLKFGQYDHTGYSIPVNDQFGVRFGEVEHIGYRIAFKDAGGLLFGGEESFASLVIGFDAGGVLFGGEESVSQQTAQLDTGGVLFGGEELHWYSPGVYGTDCDSALPLSLDVDYGPFGGGADAEHWFSFAWDGSGYGHVSADNFPGSSGPFTVEIYGGDCSSLFPVGSGGPPYVTFFLGSSDTIKIRVPVAYVAFTLRIGHGPTP